MRNDIFLICRNSSRFCEMPIRTFLPNSSVMPSIAVIVMAAMAVAVMDIGEVVEAIGDTADREE